MSKVENAVQLTNQLKQFRKINISTQAVRKALKQSGMKSIVKQKKPRLSDKNREARLRFAEEHKDWTVEQWKEVVWSDETKSIAWDRMIGNIHGLSAARKEILNIIRELQNLVVDL